MWGEPMGPPWPLPGAVWTAVWGSCKGLVLTGTGLFYVEVHWRIMESAQRFVSG